MKMMSTPAAYRENAAECMAAMRAAVIPEVRAVLFAMAQRWIDLAERFEPAAPGKADPPDPGISPGTPHKPLIEIDDPGSSP
jgi:hypothetical protein